MIPLFKSLVHTEAKDKVAQVLQSGWLGLGPETEKFETEVAAYLGARYAVATNSCTEALRIAVHIASRRTNQGYAITTPNTFVSTNSVLLQNDMMPVFTDIDYMTGNMKFGDATMALRMYQCGLLMLVHYGGAAANVSDFEELAETYSIEVIHDCAHSFGAMHDGKKLGADAKYACFSFHAVKPLAIGDGGMLVTNDEEVATLARRLRWLGIDKSTYQRSQIGYSWDYDIQQIGYKSHMWDVQAAIGRGQLLKYDEDLKKRNEIVNRYRKNLYSYSFPKPYQKQNGLSANHLFVALFENTEQRQKAMDNLTAHDIQYGLHYKPNYLYEPFRHYPNMGCLEMEKFYDTALSLPMHLFLTEQDVDLICDLIRS
jgi:perosamine synthetase